MQLEYYIAIDAATADRTQIYTHTRPDGTVFRFDIDRPYYFQVKAEVGTKEEAQSFVSRFPKFVGLKGTGLYHGPDVPSTGYVWLQIKLSADLVNGGVNETGIRRIRSFVRTCEKLGIELVRESKLYENNSPRSIEEYGWK